ncbi:MAG: gfo/Idh/MocA family oxidoreductase, partial [Actinobacteria bacterium]|nr:gfo/Idh/MocA family oxidoreductase [Actinomycetota bacterium]
MTSSLKIGVIGVGAMGVLHARTVANCPETELVWVCDKNQVAGEMAARRFESNWIREPDLGVVDAVVVSVPTQFHYQIAIEVVSSGVPLLVEKPLATSFTEISEIVQQSRRSSVPLMCGLLERFNPAVRTAFELVREPIHVKTVRHSPLTPRIT